MQTLAAGKRVATPVGREPKIWRWEGGFAGQRSYCYCVGFGIVGVAVLRWRCNFPRAEHRKLPGGLPTEMSGRFCASHRENQGGCNFRPDGRLNYAAMRNAVTRGTKSS